MANVFGLLMPAGNNAVIEGLPQFWQEPKPPKRRSALRFKPRVFLSPAVSELPAMPRTMPRAECSPSWVRIEGPVKIEFERKAG